MDEWMSVLRFSGSSSPESILSYFLIIMYHSTPLYMSLLHVSMSSQFLSLLLQQLWISSQTWFVIISKIMYYNIFFYLYI